jgi:choice-of-anchor A domain-containing protein
VNGSFETACPGLALPQGRFTDYDVIAFGSFTANTGDIEQRVAVGGNFNVGSGFSVGLKIDSSDAYVPYAILVAGDASFGSGAVYPDGSSSLAEEDIFVGGSFTGASYLASRVTSCSTPHCLDSYFTAARNCYSNFQNALAAHTDNVATVIQWSGLYITCNDQSSSTYYMTLTASNMAAYTWISTSSCNSNANWVINVVGNDDVSFSGGEFPANPNQILWNVQGSGRTINVDTTVYGSILAPSNNINEPNGSIDGKVIANNIVSLQINKTPCFVPPSNNNNGPVPSK